MNSKFFGAISALVISIAAGAQAQTASGNATYPDVYAGPNGETYFCRNLPPINGASRLGCIDPAVQLPVQPSGMVGGLNGTTGAIVGGVLILGIVAAVGSSSGT